MITKTKYVAFRSCPRCYYYLLNNKDQAKKTDENALKRIDDGFKVNKFAYKLFPGIVLIKQDFESVNENKQVELTKKYLDSNATSIAEASFTFEDLFCAVDILTKNDNGYDIYEVKASNKIEDKMDEYGPDVAFQKYVLEKCGLKIKNCYIVHLNKDFVKNGEIDASQLLKVDCIDTNAQFNLECSLVDQTIDKIRALQTSKDVPDYGSCYRDCPFFSFCHKDLPTPNVLELNRITLTKAHDWIKEGIKSFDDLAKANKKLTKFQVIQLQTYLNKKNNFNELEIKRFLNSLTYPIYHLDFETMNEAIPLVDGTSPYQQVPFQYSLHIEYEDGKLEHEEFLGKRFDCQYELAKKLVKDIKPDGLPMAYNMAFEKGVIAKLAKQFPDLEKSLMAIHEKMVDLLEPFRAGGYYNSIQHGSNSIKQVMPAIVPEMEKAYKDLKYVKNGGQALALFPKLITEMKGHEFDDNYQGLLDYCYQDTYSMVKILEKLRKLCK